MPSPKLDPLDQAAAAARALRVAESELDRAVIAARASGASWDQLMNATSINRETLRRRYSGRKTP